MVTSKRKKSAPSLTFKSLMARAQWQPLPAILVLTGDAALFKNLILKRFLKELFGEDAPDLRRYQGPQNDAQKGELAPATILDELRTPSFFSATRAVVVEPADVFLNAHSEVLLPHVETGFSGGHLVLMLERRLDGRTRLAKELTRTQWVVTCNQPYDRPPPWDTRTEPWDSELSHWLSGRAREKGLVLDPRLAFRLHEQSGTDLSVLDEELEKLTTYLAGRKTKTIDAAAIETVVSDLKEDSIFHLVDLVLEGRRAEALRSINRLFARGHHMDKRTHVTEPMGIALPLIASFVNRLRSLRRARAMDAANAGKGPDAWLQAGLVQRPFLSRFERQYHATKPQRITGMFRALYEIDRSIKRGGNPVRELELFVVRFAAP